MRQLKSIEKLFEIETLHEGSFYSRWMNEIINNAADEHFGFIPSHLDIAEICVEDKKPYVGPVLLFENLKTGELAFASKVPDTEHRYRLDVYEEPEEEG